MKVNKKFKRTLTKRLQVILLILVLLLNSTMTAMAETLVIPAFGGASASTYVTSDTTSTVPADGTYFIELYGGGYYETVSLMGTVDTQGGYAAGYVNLKKGDVLSFTLNAGGTGYYARNAGQPGLGAYLNGTFILGAGGAGGGWNTAQQSFGGGESVTANNGRPFSGGGGGAGRSKTSNSYTPGGNGAGGALGAATGPTNGQAGGNYFNTSVVYDTINGTAAIPSSSSRTPQMKITNVGITTKMVQQIVTDTMSKTTVMPNTVTISCAQRQPFDVNVVANPSIAAISVPAGLTTSVVDSAKGLVNIKGTLNTSGRFRFDCSSVTVFVNVIQSPDSSNINVTFN